jgi:phosphatidylserine/phosphatidylglycerophosphate/cardiolipin synthase-like enzyme
MGSRACFSITESGVQFFMRKLVRAAVALAVLALGAVIVPPAQAVYMPTAGAAFNDPTGLRSQQTVLMDRIIAAVNNVPSGSVIRVVAYSFDYQPMADALIAAKKRGAQVRLLIDSHTETAQIRQLRSAFGTGTSDGTYLRTCRFSCMANTASFIHSKLYLFSRTGGATHVSMNSSANPAETGVSKSWNNTYTTVGDKTLYDANVDNFNDMLPDKTNTNYYHTVESGNLKEYFFPRAGSTKSSDTLYNILNDVSCPSTIKVTTYFWTNLRLYLAQKLTALKKQGCNIEVIYPDGPGSQDTIKSKITPELLNGNIPTYNTRPFNGLGLYVHNKVILIDGTYQGVPGQKIVYATSQNLTMTSLRESNEVMLRIPIPSVYQAYLDNFVDIRNHAVRVRSTAAETTAGVNSASEESNGKAPSDNSPDPDE